MISLLTIILNIGIKRSQKVNTLINFILGIVIGADYKQYDDCDNQCKDLLSKRNLYDANILAEYTSVFQMSCLFTLLLDGYNIFI